MSEYKSTEKNKAAFWKRIDSFFTGREFYEYELMEGTRVYRWIKILRIKKEYIDVRVSCLKNKYYKERTEYRDRTVERVRPRTVITPPPVFEREVIEIEEVPSYEHPDYSFKEEEKIIPEPVAQPVLTPVQEDTPSIPIQAEELFPDIEYEEYEPETEVEKVPKEVQVKKTRVKKEIPRALIRFPGLTSMRSLYIIAKNSAAGADMAYNNIEEIKAEIEDINKELSKLRTPVGASEAVRTELANRRNDLNQRKKYRNEELLSSDAKGRSLEVAADEYAYLIKCLNGEIVDYRKTPRFNEEVIIRVTDQDLKDLKDYLFD